MNAGDWCYLTGKSIAIEQDSVMIAATRKLRFSIQLQNPGTFNTPVTIDSISAQSIIKWYKILLFAPFVEIRGRGIPIFNAITAHANLAPFIAEIDASVTDLFIKERTRGKNYLQDNN